MTLSPSPLQFEDVSLSYADPDKALSADTDS